jgi:hypothetical protein
VPLEPAGPATVLSHAALSLSTLLRRIDAKTPLRRRPPQGPTIIVAGLIIAIYAITVNPNDATTMIGFPP